MGLDDHLGFAFNVDKITNPSLQQALASKQRES
jgi:hypothetical protein